MKLCPIPPPRTAQKLREMPSAAATALVAIWGATLVGARSPNATLGFDWPREKSTDILPEECSAECGTDKLADSLHTLIKGMKNKYKFDDLDTFMAGIGPFVDELFTGVHQLFCQSADVAECILSNEAKCASGGKWQSWGDLPSTFFSLNPVVAAINAVINLVVSSVSKMEKCTCDLCPGASNAVGRLLGGAVTALFNGVDADEDLSKVGDNLHKALLGGICPMVGAIDCMAGKDVCNVVSTELHTSVAKDWINKYLNATEKKSTDEMCMAAGVETSLLQFTTSQSAPKGGLVAAGFVAVVLSVALFSVA